ncbi:MAG: hypothetical protein H0W76_24170 [Pyrinomonadaceae bacterium]|nr:hypothetical protein [Pyrinomonadaceae bacterium]
MESERQVTSPGKPTVSRQLAQKVTPADLRFDQESSTAVISSAQKFIIPVPAFNKGGEPLVYPEGHERARQQILDYQGKPVGKRGLVFLNAKDQSWQAVQGDGQGVIIINEVTQDQAEMLHKKVQEFQENSNDLTLDQLKKVLDYARSQLKLNDMYNSTRSFIKSKMSPVTAGERPHVNGEKIEAFGLMKRDDRDVCQAVFVPGSFVFEGPAATPQVFENGGVIVKQGEDVRGVQPEVFVRTYKFKDGRPVTSPAKDLKAQGD